MREVYQDFFYGCPGVSRGWRHSLMICQGEAFPFEGKLKILVVGAGNGYDLVQFIKAGHDCIGLELYIPDIPLVKKNSIMAQAKSMPFKNKSFDLVFCAEVMEHIPAEITDLVLRECKRVAENFYFTIATRDDGHFNTHVNVHNGSYWIQKFEDLGFTISHAEINPRVYIDFNRKYIQKTLYPDGVMLYGRC